MTAIEELRELVIEGRKLDFYNFSTMPNHEKSRVQQWATSVQLFAEHSLDASSRRTVVSPCQYLKSAPVRQNYQELMSVLEGLLEYYNKHPNALIENQIPQQSGMRMAFEPLTKNCEDLLMEILSHRDADGNCDIGYWEKKFEGIKFVDEVTLRSQFGILKNRDMITLKWAGNVPYILYVLENGLSYFEQKEIAMRQFQPANADKTITTRKEYDVFISHATKDKLSYVDELHGVFRKLGVKIFYDTEEISWGDNWKQVLLDGTAAAEFAVIVISENFFGREWTERELDEFLKRQNESGQKIVLPLLHGISVERLKEKYPSLGNIQVIDTERFSKEEIVILFAKELIKRLKQREISK